MSNAELPARPSLEFLRKLAKDRLQQWRRSEPHSTLAAAQLDVAREHGFTSWRALKAHVDQQHQSRLATFLDACRQGDTGTVAQMLAVEPGLAQTRDSHGTSPLHAAAARGHLEVVNLVLARGADVNARDIGDNATPLHFAAGGGHVAVVRALIDAGADVHGDGDVHESGVIGWATVIGQPSESRWAAADLLLERGARHHIFSALATGDAALVRRLVETAPEALERRMSRFEHARTPLHVAVEQNRSDLLDLLIELGADLEGTDLSGRTPLEAAMMSGNTEAARRLSDAGAQPPASRTPEVENPMTALAASVRKSVAMITVPDVAKTLEWYTALGFRELARFDDDGVVNFGMVAYGGAELMLNVHGRKGAHDVSLWFYTSDVDALYQTLKARQLEAAQAALAGTPGPLPAIEFSQDIEDMFYGARQFCIRDLNGYEIYFVGER